MTPERWHEIKAAFEAVDSTPPEDRPSLLDRLCEGDDMLRRDLEKLLSAGARSSDELLDVVGAAASFALGGPSRELTGQSLGPYRIEKLIGSGGMGYVYAAEDSRLGRVVALKLLPDMYVGNADRIRRFQQEARAASALNHPNIVTIHDFGQADGQYYMATELVRGKTLRALIGEGPLPARQVAQIGVQIAGALSSAHEAGIVHRDIKPENIMIRPDGYVKVLDFGLAKLRESTGEVRSAATKTGTVMGTTAYMSPEQVRGLAVSSSTDIFSLGVVLYEMATGQNPFRGKTGADQIAAVLEHDPRPLRSLIPAVPEELEAIVGKCLRKERSERYQSAQELLDDLRLFQVDLESTTRSGPRVTQAKKRMWPVVAAAMVVLGLATFFSVRYFTGEPDWFKTTKLSKVPGEGGGITPSGRYLVYNVRLPDGRMGVNLRQLNAAQRLELVPPTRSKIYSWAVTPDEAFLYYTTANFGEPESSTLFRVPMLGGTPQKILENVHGLAFSPSGSRFAFTRPSPGGATLWTADADGTQLREVLRSSEARPFYVYTWTSDGMEIYFTDGARTSTGVEWRVKAVSPAGGAVRNVASMGSTPIMNIARLPDNAGFVVNKFDPESNLPQVWRMLRTGAFTRITHDLNEYQGLSITADGRRIAVNQAERLSEFWVIDTADPSAEAKPVTDSNQRFGEGVWAFNGSIVGAFYVSGGKSNIWAMSSSGADKHALTPSGSTETELVACPDRDEVVYVSQKGGNANLWRVRPATNEVKQLTFGVNDRYPQCLRGGTVVYRSQIGSKIQTFQVSLDGGAPAEFKGSSWEESLSLDGKLKSVEYTDEKTHTPHKAIQTQDGSKTLTRFESDNSASAWEPHGSGVAHVLAKDGFPEVWFQPISGGPPRKLSRFRGKTVFSLNWSPDGRYIVCAVGRITMALILIDDVR